ncbi:fibroblast growth factor-binding protein 2-like [Synchiropus picturatus]
MRPAVVLLLLGASLSAALAQTSNSDSKPRTNWDEPIRFNTKSKDACTMAVTPAGDLTRLRVSCKGQDPALSYYCDFQGRPNLCRPYTNNPRHYFTQLSWELRKLSHACQGPKILRPFMCKRFPDEAQMTFLTYWPKSATLKPLKPGQETRKPVVVPAQPKPAATAKPARPQPVRPAAGKGSQAKKTTPKPAKTTTARPSEVPESEASRLANEYCWQSFQGICSYVIGWFQ